MNGPQHYAAGEAALARVAGREDYSSSYTQGAAMVAQAHFTAALVDAMARQQGGHWLRVLKSDEDLAEEMDGGGDD